MYAFLDLVFFIICIVFGLILWNKKPNKAVIYFVLAIIFLMSLYHRGTEKQLDEIKDLVNNIETKQVIDKDVEKVE